MEIRINGQRYKDWHRVPLHVRQELVESGVFLDGDGTGVPDEMLPTAGAPLGVTPRYALTINGAPYDPDHPVPALLGSVVQTLGHHGDARTANRRSRRGPRMFRSSSLTGGERAAGGFPPSQAGGAQQASGRPGAIPPGQVRRTATQGPAAPSQQIAHYVAPPQPRPGYSEPARRLRPGAGWDASPDETTAPALEATNDETTGTWDAGGWDSDGGEPGTSEPAGGYPGSSDASPTAPPQSRWGETAVTRWQGPGGTTRTEPGRAEPGRSEPDHGRQTSGTSVRWDVTPSSPGTRSGTTDPGVIVETRTIPRWVVVSALLVLAVLVVVLLALTGT